MSAVVPMMAVPPFFGFPVPMPGLLEVAAAAGASPERGEPPLSSPGPATPATATAPAVAAPRERNFLRLSPLDGRDPSDDSLDPSGVPASFGSGGFIPSPLCSCPPAMLLCDDRTGRYRSVAFWSRP